MPSRACVLGADAAAAKTEVRVRGCTPAFMLPNEAYTNVRRELPRAFGSHNAAVIKVQFCVHMASTGIKRCVFKLLLQGFLGDRWALHPVHKLAPAPPSRAEAHAGVQGAAVQGGWEAAPTGGDKPRPTYPPSGTTAIPWCAERAP